MSANTVQEALSTIDRLTALHPDLKDLFEKSYGYAVFSAVGRASAVLGVSHGKGVVFEQHKAIGVVRITGVTIGVQVGGQTFSEVVFFPKKELFDQLAHGEITFTANASAVLVKAAATGTSDFHGVIAKAYSQGGMLLEVSLGVQKLSLVPDAELKQHAAAMPHASEEPPPSLESTNEPDPSTRHRLTSAARTAGSTIADATERAGRGAADLGGNVIEHVGEGASKTARFTSKARAISNKVKGVLPRSLRAALMPASSMISRRSRHLAKKLMSPITKLEKEQELSKTLHPETQIALERMLQRDDRLRERLEKAAGYAVFPSVGKASAVVGATYGLGEVFARGHLIGYAALVQITLGLQVGGDTFMELVIFDKQEALDRFKEGKVAFAANAAAVLVKAATAATLDRPAGADVHIVAESGLLLEAAIGAQKFVYRGAAMTRGKTLDLGPAPKAIRT
jgi:lipid-binding SYLF domain-containing protein